MVSKINWWGTLPNALVRSTAVRTQFSFILFAWYISSFREEIWSIAPFPPPMNPFWVWWKTDVNLFSFKMKPLKWAAKILYMVDVMPIGRQFFGILGSDFLYSIIVFVDFQELGTCFEMKIALKISANISFDFGTASLNKAFEIPSLPWADI